MGIIAGIAIPTTIAVINRQKKNSAEKSVESVISTMKNLILEAQASSADGGVIASATYNGAATPSAFSITQTDTSKPISGFGADDMAVDSFKGVGTITGTLSGTTITYTGSIALSGYTVTVNNDGTVHAS